MNLRILFIIHRLNYGGAEKNFAFLMNNLAHKGYDTHLLTYENQNVDQYISPGVKHIHFENLPITTFILKRFVQILKVKQVIHQIKPDLIISFLTYPNIISIIASLGTRIPVIISERGDPTIMRSWFTKFRDLVYNFADGFVFQTKGAKKYYNKKIQSKAIIIPNPVVLEKDMEKWEGDRENIIVNVGRFEIVQKRQDNLIKAFGLIYHKHPNIQLVLFGDGDDELQITRIIKECNLENKIILAGVTKNVLESIKKAKLFVLTSDYEGMPNALLEAMSIGIPCISTNFSLGGGSDLIDNMENGILVEPGSIEDLANAMDYLLSNPHVAEKMGKNARKIINHFHPENTISLWEKYINEIFVYHNRKTL